MATNDFLTFAAASGANVLTQSAYADPSNTDRQTGYVTGTASSLAVNKTLRQTSIMSSMIGKFIVDYAAVNVVDDGTINTIETNFAQAILNVAAGRVIQISDVVGLTTALNGKLSTTGNAASSSKWSAPITLTLTGTVGGAVAFDGSGNVSLSTSIADGALTIAKTAGLQSALNLLAPINNTNLTGASTAQNLSVAGSPVVTRAQFTTVADSNGSTTKLPDGTIIARGALLQTGSTTMLTFPAGSGFTSPPVVTLTPVNGGIIPTGYTFAVDVPTTTGVAVHQSGPTFINFYWIAIGR